MSSSLRERERERAARGERGGQERQDHHQEFEQEPEPKQEREQELEQENKAEKGRERRGRDPLSFQFAMLSKGLGRTTRAYRGLVGATRGVSRKCEKGARVRGVGAVKDGDIVRRLGLSLRSSSTLRPSSGAGSKENLASEGKSGNRELLTSVRTLLDNGEEGSLVQVRGWVKSIRRQKKFSFVTVSDGSCPSVVQLVTKTEHLPDNVNFDASVIATGLVTVGGRDKKKELNCIPQSEEEDSSASEEKNGIVVVGPCDGPSYPLQKKYHTPEFLRGIAHLRSRSQRIGAVLRVRSRAAMEVHKFFDEEGFINVHVPVMTSSDCEGAGECFEVPDPFTEDGMSYLSVSGQLHAEMFAQSHSKVYTFGPTFRAENSHTNRHLNEFYMIEPEIAFASKQDAMDLAERCIKSVINGVLERNGSDVETLFELARENKEGEPADLSKVQAMESDILRARDRPFVRMSYDEAVHILQSKEHEFENSFPIRWGLPLQTEHERYIAEQHCGRTPVFIDDYPARCKPFYMKQLDRKDTDTSLWSSSYDKSRVGCFDLIVPRLGELVGGSAREEDLERLQNAMDLNGIYGLEWYKDLRRFGSTPHAGWGMGFERLVLFLTGVENIRDSIPLPRTPDAFKY